MDDWRNQLQLTLIDQLTLAGNRALQAGDRTSAASLAARALRLDPYNERAMMLQEKLPKPQRGETQLSQAGR